MSRAARPIKRGRLEALQSACLAAALAAAACGRGTAPPPREAAAGEPLPAAVAFTEVAAEVGLDFVHGNGAFGAKWLPETMGSGCAWLDFDGDGDLDALLLSGTDWPGHETGGRTTSALYRNDGGSFTDVSREAGLDAPFFAMGVTVGDHDDDGDPDLFITAVGPDRLYRNDGGRFVDVAPALDLDHDGFGSSATWLDFDRDADLDLLVLDYVEWSPERDLWCTLDGTSKTYCTPESYPGVSPRLYRNDRDRFTDVTTATRVRDDGGKGLGVAVLDVDGDGRDDVVIANDTQPNSLLHAEADGTFSQQGVLAGIAFDEAGHARGAMGIDAGDVDGDGRPDVAIGNFANEMVALYLNEGGGRLTDVAPSSEIGPASLPTLAFATLFLDFDLDGRLDLLVANGHLEPDVVRVQPDQQYAQPMHLFRNLGGGRFTDVAPSSPALSQPVVARGAAVGDFDGDLDLDILVNTVGGPARLLRNDGADGRRALRVLLEGGAGSTRDALGARVKVVAGGRTQWAWKRAASGYLSQSEPALTFGLGESARAEKVEVLWPSGRRSVVEGVPAGTVLEIREADAS